MNASNRVVVRARSVGARLAVSQDNRRVIGAALLVGVLTLIVKIVAMGREVLVAAKLGTGDAAEAYIAAWVIPGFVSLLISDAMTGALLPSHARARAERGEEAADQVFAETLLVSILLLLGCTGVLALLPNMVLPLLASNFDAGKLTLTAWLWSLMMPAVFVGGLAAIWIGMLNAENRFGLAAASPIAVPVVSVAALLFAPGRAVDALTIGFVVGNIVQLGLLGRELRRHRIRLLPGWFGGLPETHDLARQFLPLLGNGIVFGGLPLVDTAMAASLGDRQLAILNYGTRLILPILGISTMALGTVVFPFFSRLVAEQDWERLQRTLSTYTRLILAASVPATVVLMLLSKTIVRVLFQHGEFTSTDTVAVSHVQATLALMIPCYTLAAIYSRVLISLRKSQLMLLVSVFVFVVNLIGDYLFKELIGIDGIALATVVNYAIQATVIIWLCRRLLDEQIRAEQE